MRPLLVMFAPHEPNRDPRIHWEAKSAARAFDVFVLGLDEGIGLSPAETRDGYTILRRAQAGGLRTALRFAKRLVAEAASPAERALLLAAAAAAAPPVALALALRRTLRLGGGLLDATLGRLVAPVPLLRRIRRPFRRLATGTGLVVRLARLLGRRHPGLRLAGALATHFAQAGSTLLDLYLSTGLQADIVHANDLNALLPAVAVKRLHRSRLVYDAHELWPASVPEAPPALVRLLAAYERRLVRRADAIFTVSPALAAIMERWYRLPRVGILPNAEFLEPDGPALDTGLRALAGDRTVFLFQGNFAKERGLEELLRDWRRVDHTRAFLALRGPRWSFAEELERDAADLVAAGAVAFLPPVSEPDLVRAAREADVGLIPYRPANLNNRHCCPNKLSQYLQAGVAVLSNATSFVPAVLADEEAGLAYDSDDPDSLPAAVRRLADDPALLARLKANARRAGRTRWHWDRVAAPLMNAYRRLAPGKGMTVGGPTPAPRLVGHGPTRPPGSRPAPSFPVNAGKEGTETLTGVWGPRPQRGAGAEPRTFSLLGTSVRVDGEIDWSMGWIEGPVAALRARLYAGFPHNHLVRGDVKLPWELNKHLHFQTMALDYERTGERRLADAFMAQIDHWRAKNPFGFNLAWLEPLIVAHRLVSWTLAGRSFRPALDPAFLDRFRAGIREHLLDLDARYELAEKASNHLLADLCGAIAGAAAHPEIAEARPILERAVTLLEAEVDRQIPPDGVHYEMSTAYGRVVLEFLEVALDELARAGEPAPPRAIAAACRLRAFLDRLRRSDGSIPNLSDADGARVRIAGLRPPPPAGGPPTLQTSRLSRPSSPHSRRRGAEGVRGLGSVTPAGDGAEPRAVILPSAFFPRGGIAVFRDAAGTNLLTFDSGNISMSYDDDAPHGTHGHDDTLSVTLFARGREFITDPGSGAYTGDLKLHDALRVSTAHATFSLGPAGDPPGPVESHSVPCGPWTLARRARPVRAGAARAGALLLAAGAHDGYRRHPGAPVAARLVVAAPDGLWILLDVAAPTAELSPGSRAAWRATFPFSPEVAVEADASGFRARSGEASLRGDLSTSAPPAIAATVVSGDREGGRGIHASDYGIVVPSPWAIFDATVAFPFFACWVLRAGASLPPPADITFTGNGVEVVSGGRTIRLSFAEGLAAAARAGFPRAGVEYAADGSCFCFTGVPLDPGGETPVELG